MSSDTLDTDIITSSEVEDMPVAPPPVESNWFSFVPMLLIFILFYFFLIRPQEKRRREHEDFVAGVKKGEEVLTNSGLFGVVRKINDSDDTVMIEVAKDIEIKVLKNSIANITSRKEVEKVVKAAKDSKKAK